jgi:hypothetical protein
MRRPLIVAGVLSAALLTAKVAVPVAALTDPTGAPLPGGVHLSFPLLNLAFAPLFDTWDGVTLLAMPRLHAFLMGALVLGVAWSIGSAIRERRLRWGLATAKLAGVIAALALFVGAGAAWRRPMAHIAGVPDSLVVVDLHSHTNASHDVKGWLQGDFDLEASRRWHARGGFDAFFVTDHNRIDGWKGKDLATPPTACPGEELSLWRAHIVTLGNTDSIPRELYADSAAGLARLFGESERRWHALTLASIPEYDDNHFEHLAEWIAEGLDGFEVSNPAPKANRQWRERQDSVVRLAQRSGTFIAGVTDQHGMGATAQAWTLVKDDRTAPTAATPDLPYVCAMILHHLAARPAAGIQVVERHRVRLDSAWPLWTTPIAVIWEGWRAATWWQMLGWFFWIWQFALSSARRPKSVTV